MTPSMNNKKIESTDFKLSFKINARVRASSAERSSRGARVLAQPSAVAIVRSFALLSRCRSRFTVTIPLILVRRLVVALVLADGPREDPDPREDDVGGEGRRGVGLDELLVLPAEVGQLLALKLEQLAEEGEVGRDVALAAADEVERVVEAQVELEHEVGEREGDRPGDPRQAVDEHADVL